MKIAVRGGHNHSVPGASGIINEVTEDRKVYAAVIKYLKAAGHTVYDVTSPDTYNTVSSDLSYGVNKANSLGVDLFISIHFNNAYSSYNGEIGTECWVYSLGGTSNTIASRIVAKLATVFKNRGVKSSTGLYELRNTNMPAIIVEVCFVEATGDVAKYRTKGSDEIGRLIANGIMNK